MIWLTAAELDALEPRSIGAEVGLGAVLSGLLLQLASDAESGRPAHDDQRVAHIIRGLLSAIAAERVDDESSEVSTNHRIVILAMQVIHARLDDSRMTTQSIASTLGISVRTLQGAFSASSITVASTVRALRQERAGLSARSSDGVQEVLADEGARRRAMADRIDVA